MIITNGNDTYGNTALNPQIDTSYKKYKKLNKQRKQHLKKIQDKRLVNKIKVIKKVIMIFVVAVVLVFRYAYICNLRKNIISTQREISRMSKQNNELTVELLKYNNLAYIETTATNKFKMVKSDYKNSIYCNLSENNIRADKTKKISKQKNKIIDVLISKLF